MVKLKMKEKTYQETKPMKLKVIKIYQETDIAEITKNNQNVFYLYP